MDTVAALLDATLDAIADVGEAAATTEEIARRAGVTQGAVFHHFSTRQELIAAAVRRHTARMAVVYEDFAHEVREGELAQLELREVLARIFSFTHTAEAGIWIEVIVAGRRWDDDRTEIAGAIEADYAIFREALRGHHELRDLHPDALEVWFQLWHDVLIGASLWYCLGDHGRLDEAAAAAAMAELAPLLDRQAR